jgi:hypothetical protein
MKIHDRICDDRVLRQYTGGSAEINRVERIRFMEGKAKDSEAYDVTTGGGLRLVILPDRGLDIVSASYRGINLSFLSKNGVTGAAATNPLENEFLHYFSGGLLTTCGIRNVGPSCREDNGEYHPIHGRYNTIPATQVGVRRPDSETIEISGTIRETALFGCDLQLDRCIRIDNARTEISVEDVLTNHSAQAEEFMLLYHYNFGFPLLQEGCRLEFEPDDTVTPRTPEAARGMDRHTIIEAPDDRYDEQVFFHEQRGDENRYAGVRLINPSLGLVAELRYDTTVLPVLAEWKSMRSGDYALGLEPSNNFIKGRVEERRNGTLRTIEPHGTLRFRTILTIADL